VQDLQGRNSALADFGNQFRCLLVLKPVFRAVLLLFSGRLMQVVQTVAPVGVLV
jgi:hypothetical protein